MEWDDDEDDYCDSQYAGVGAPSQVQLTPQAEPSATISSLIKSTRQVNGDVEVPA